MRIFELLDDVLLFLFICLFICGRRDGNTCNGVPEQGSTTRLGVQFQSVGPASQPDDLPVNASASMAYVVGGFETIVTVLVRPGSVSWAG